MNGLPWWRADPAACDRMLRRLRRALKPLEAAIHQAAKGATTLPPDPNAIAEVKARAHDWAHLGAALDDCEPYPCSPRVAEVVDASTGELRAALFSLGHQEPSHFLVACEMLVRDLKGQSRKGCGCSGPISLLRGGERYEWWLPPAPQPGAFVALPPPWVLAAAGNAEAVPVTRMELHETVTRALLAEWRKTRG